MSAREYYIFVLSKDVDSMWIVVTWPFQPSVLHNVGCIDYTCPSLSPSPSLDDTRVMVFVWRLRGNIIRTSLCWIVWHCSQSAAYLYEQFLQVQQIGFVTLGDWDPYITV